MGRIRARLLFGTLMVAGVAAWLWVDWAWSRYGRLDGAPAAAGVAVLVLLAFGELARLVRAAGARVLGVSGRLAAAALAVLPWCSWHLLGRLNVVRFPWVIAAAVFSLWLIFAEQMLRRRTPGALRDVAATVLAAAYLGFGGAAVVWLRLHWGPRLLLIFLAAAKFCDVGAWAAGTAAGRHKLIPWLSPHKSWEGLAGGLATAAGVAAALAWALEAGADLPPATAAVFGALVGAAGQFADLCESLLKRSADAKDSGALLPQFGGVLDLIDSPLLAGPVALIVLEAVN
jgi:phosphatidate cytidylyltransferase